MLKFKNGLPFIEDVYLNDISKVCKTPFYIYSQNIITQKVENIKKILGKKIFFSVKSNSNQAILRLMSSLDIGADVVSIGELKRSLSAGFDSSKIIFQENYLIGLKLLTLPLANKSLTELYFIFMI